MFKEIRKTTASRMIWYDHSPHDKRFDPLIFQIFTTWLVAPNGQIDPNSLDMITCWPMTVLAADKPFFIHLPLKITLPIFSFFSRYDLLLIAAITDRQQSIPSRFSKSLDNVFFLQTYFQNKAGTLLVYLYFVHNPSLEIFIAYPWLEARSKEPPP